MFQQHLFWQLQPSNSVKGQAPRRVSVATFGTCQVLLFPDDSSCISSRQFFQPTSFTQNKRMWTVDHQHLSLIWTLTFCVGCLWLSTVMWKWSETFNCEQVYGLKKSCILLGERGMFFFSRSVLQSPQIYLKTFFYLRVWDSISPSLEKK